MITLNDPQLEFLLGEFLTDYNLKANMRRRGNYYNNPVAQSFFDLLNIEMVRRKTCQARQNVFDDIEMFTIQNVGIFTMNVVTH